MIVAGSFFMAAVLYTAYASPPDNIKKKILLDVNSSGKRIEVNVGDEIQIELGAIGSAGYGWYFDKLDNDLFELIGEEKKVTSGEGKDMVGTPVISIWRLKAMKPGRSIIRMSCYRLWEGKDKAINQFEVNVDIAP
jgi:predicted secreted protein